MQVSVVISFLAATVAAVSADSFSAENQAIWIDRHNYFRTTGLPWSAGDMRRIGWSADLASTAASTAAKCAASTAVGVNTFQSTSSNSSSIIDEAIQQWVVETSMTTLKTLAQPGANGVDVGAGTYNSYSQVLWAATTSVGCATASCSGGDMVVCEYSPAGNDGSSPWYVHAEPAADCPSGTTAKQGLCIVEGDAANNQIAAIPAGKLTYEVYPAYVANMQTVLIEQARAIANGSGTNSTGSTTTATKAPAAATTPSTAATETPSATTAAPTSSSLETSTTSSKEDGGKTGSTKQSTTSKSGDSSTATKTDKKTTTSASTSDSASGSENKQDSTKQDSTKQSSENTDESAPGTVKASSDTGSTFTNQQTSTTTGSSTEQKSSATTAPTTTTAPSTASTESTTAQTTASSGGAATSINNKSSTTAGSGISAAGMAGMIVLAIVGIAAFGVVMSYKRNQQRQREIMRDGGIRVI